MFSVFSLAVQLRVSWHYDSGMAGKDSPVASTVLVVDISLLIQGNSEPTEVYGNRDQVHKIRLLNGDDSKISKRSVNYRTASVRSNFVFKPNAGRH